jgi:hypothetical protein
LFGIIAGMNRYFFHVFNDEETRDEVGQLFSDLAAARASAERDCISLAMESIAEHRHLVMHHRVDIDDEAGVTVSTVHFGDVIEVHA